MPVLLVEYISRSPIQVAEEELPDRSIRSRPGVDGIEGACVCLINEILRLDSRKI